MTSSFVVLFQKCHQGFLKDIDEFIKYGHRKGLKILLEVHTKQEFQNALKAKDLTTTIRASRGQDIDAACGLLSTKEMVAKGDLSDLTLNE